MAVNSPISPPQDLSAVRLSTPLPFEADEIRGQLARVLDSASFKTSKKSCDFLRHVVESTTEGKAHLLKERALGIAVFDRPPDYDTGQDPIVRNSAGQVRKRLAQYYYAAGHETQIRIDLPPGSYVPEFSSPAPTPVQPVIAPDSAPLTAIPEQHGTWLPLNRWRIGAALAIVLVAGVGTLATLDFPASQLDAFREPVLNSSRPVVLCLGQGHTYKLNEVWDRYFEGQAGECSPQPLPSAAIPWKP